MRRRLGHHVCRLMMIMATGGAVFQLSSCDPNVRDAVLSGLETTSISLSNILIQALFAGFGDMP